MDEYTRLLTKLSEYLNKPNVESTECTNDIISAYDLYCIVDEKLQELRDVQFDSTFVDEINKDNTVIKKVGHIFKKRVPYNEKKCTTDMVEHNGKRGVITLGFTSNKARFGVEYIDIIRDVDSDEIYFGKYASDKIIVERYYDRLTNIFDTLEKFQALYQSGIGSSGTTQKQTFSDSFLDVDFSYDSYGRTSIDIRINKEADKEEIYSREWYQRKSLSTFVDENKEDFLRRIPINVSELNHTCKTIVEEYKEKQNVPQLIKK